MHGSTASLALIYVHRRLMARQINEHSAQQIRYRLADFAASVPANPKRVYKRHVEQWMERPDLAPQYLRSRLSAVRGFCRWCVAEGHMVKDPTLMVPLPVVPFQLPKRLTRDESRCLARTMASDPRSKLIVLLSLQEGLRQCEVSRANVEDIDFAERSIVIRGKGGLGEQTDALPISTETWAALTAYLALEGHSHGPLIRNRVRFDPRVRPSTIGEIIRQGMRDSGIKKPGDCTRTPHSTRHTTAHDLLGKTRDMRKVQKALRHRSIRSTEVYLRGETSELRGIMEGRSYAS